MSNTAKQSRLEIEGIQKRHEEIIRSDYNKNDEYSDSHIDALSNPEDENKVLGKGTNTGGHLHYSPDASQSKTSINYGNFRTTSGGGAYDIYGRNGQGGRNRLIQMNLYNKDKAYGQNSVDTSSNIEDGQYVLKG